MGNNQIDIKQLFYKGLRYWYLFVIFLGITLTGAYFYLKYTLPIYKSEGLILIKEDENAGQPGAELIFTELGLGKKTKILENESLVLTSTPLMLEVVKKLNLNYQYTSIDGLKKKVLYKDSPVYVVSWNPATPDTEIYGILTDNGRGGYSFELEEYGQVYEGEFGKELKLPMGTLTLSRKPGQYADTKIGILILSEYGTAKGYAETLKVEIMGEQSSTLKVSLKDHSAERARDILAELFEVYNKHSIAIRNKAFESTIEMVNERINLIAETLSVTERSLEAYRQTHEVIQLGAEGTQLMAEMSAYNKEITSGEVQIQILNGIEDFLVRNRNNFEFVPTNLSVSNPTLTTQLQRFNQLLDERKKMELSLGPAHPDLLLAQKEIQNLRETIIENIRSIRRDIEIATNASKSAREALASRMYSLPRRERELLEIERQKDVREKLYLYLLEKREEAAISMAVTSPKGLVIEPPVVSYAKLSPKPNQIWLIALFLGLSLPIGLIMFIESLNDRVHTEEDIARLTSVPVYGVLGLSSSKEKLVVRENSRTAIAEMFRLLRANLAFIAPGTPIKTLLVTSSTSGEGKSFIALNLGMTLALSGKKVLIVELDLRRPKQEMYMSIEPGEDGIVNYIIDHTMKPEQVVRNTGLHLNLDFIGSGPVPPNPGELILSARLRQIIAEMRQQYDYIILDAPPVGLVADAIQMRDLADATIYVVRSGYTYKGQLKIIDEIAKHNKLTRPFIVLNAVPFNKPGYGSYAYGYGYGYSSRSRNYYEPERRTKQQYKSKVKPRTSNFN
ncbi:MAG: polysaccharide biosynthesis tyrosine autokinase [Saprospiraceae bacterium]|nr:polysaccharide biosynthesis tyrosine autokinase [Saprospiraceae bacterium]MDW8485241.1 polysaccharide biosynthesis tyrosine autokinase [Saprospiraceae bacterium]